MADDKKKKQITDEEVTRRMQDMLHGGEPRQFGQPVAEGFQAGEVDNRSDQDAQGAPSDESTTPEKYDVNWLLSQYDAMQRDDEAEARRQKSRNMVNGIADMARAIGDLYHTNQYAPSQEVDKSLMSEVSQKRYDKAKAERDKRRAEYLNYVQNVSKQRNAEEGYRLKSEANRLKERQLDELSAYRAEEQRRKQEQLDFNKAQKEVENALKEEGLNVRERIARMNNATRQMSISQRATLISPYKEWTEVEERGGKKITIKYRLTIDPITGEIKGEELVGASSGKKQAYSQSSSTSTANKGKRKAYSRN